MRDNSNHADAIIEKLEGRETPRCFECYSPLIGPLCPACNPFAGPWWQMPAVFLFGAATGAYLFNLFS